MPTDPTPHAGQVMERTPEPEYPEPKPDASSADDAKAVRRDSGARQRSGEDPLTGAAEDIAG